MRELPHEAPSNPGQPGCGGEEWEERGKNLMGFTEGTEDVRPVN